MANALPLLGKRKKKRQKEANPLFVMWLTEWRDEAKEKGLNSQYAYGRALASLKKYPVPFASGKDCKILEFFGDKLCKMLDARLEKHVKEYGHTNVPDEMDEEPPRNIMMPENNNPNLQQEGGRKRRRTGSREYIPAQRSAAYALIITLFNDSQSVHSPGYMSKRQLMTDAQPLADASLSAPEHGSGYYSGWASMGTLIRKHYVIKQGNPARYTITDEGKELARRVVAADNQDGDRNIDRDHAALLTYEYNTSTDPGNVHNQGISSTPSTASYNPNKNTHKLNEPENSYEPGRLIGYEKPTASNYDPQRLPGSHADGYTHNIPTYPDYDPDRLEFSYIDGDGKEVMNKDQAAVVINEELGVGFLIKARYTDLLMCAKRYQLNKMDCGDGQRCLAYLHNDDADQYSNKKIERTAPVSSGTTSKLTTAPPPELRPGDAGQPSVTRPAATVIPKASTSKSVSNPYNPPLSRNDLGNLPCKGPTDNPNILQNQLGKLPEPFTPSDDSQSVEDAYTANGERVVFEPGTYTIVLCVDNREYFGTSAAAKQNLLAELNRNGVNVDVRNLAVGDFVWVAREKVVARTGQLNLPQSRELVLDFIVERKRMDDLCGSIKDGRYKEQKFRIRNSGLRRPIYLIEAYDKNLGLPEETMKQAIVNSQVVDNFYIKHTRDQKGTVAYLTIMTRQLQRKFGARRLISCSRTEIGNYDDELRHNGSLHLLHFAEFNQRNLKNQALSVRDVFAKQLMTLRGLSQEKASSLLRKYPSPRQLFMAYRACGTDRDKEQLLMGRELGLGGPNSRALYLLYNTRALQ